MALPPRSRTPLLVAPLLLAPFVALLWTSSYSHDRPRLLGFPFFYWYQFLWVVISSTLTLLAYVLVRRAERRGHGAPGTGGQP